MISEPYPVTPAPAYTTLPAAVAVTGSPRLPAISIPLCTLEAKVLTTLPSDGHRQRDTLRLDPTDLGEAAFVDDRVFFATFVGGVGDLATVVEVVLVLAGEPLDVDEAARFVVDFPEADVLDALLDGTAIGLDV